eukprot:TRINITY_DN3905_c0_g1_i3.p1 TRINITY_DN3905_c0_g1~~TRINITY_DN3905_c0_g1_i3.p1  ORF type:complete len:180 (+),score=20.48 TRINITY_DN3905_c0_g1_i3:274-813(+)
MANLLNLKELYLNNNEFTELPPVITHLTSLTNLSLPYNRLKMLPSEISCLTNLHVLCLQDNCLTDLPFELGNLPRLTSLYLYFNKQLKSFPSHIAKNPEFRGLWVDRQLMDRYGCPADISIVDHLALLHKTIFPKFLGFWVTSEEGTQPFDLLPPELKHVILKFLILVSTTPPDTTLLV